MKSKHLQRQGPKFLWRVPLNPQLWSFLW